MNKKEQRNWFYVLKIIGNIISWTLLALLVMVAGFLLYYVITSQIYAIKGESYTPKYSMYTIISPSMTPNINVYDIVIDKRLDEKDELKVGDVITFSSTSSISNGMTITHRIVELIETDEGVEYRTQGDANLTPDYAFVTRDKILGVVKLRIPQLGRVQFFLSSKGGWLFIILIPAVIIVLLDVLKLLRVIKIKQKVHNVENETKEEKIAVLEAKSKEHEKQKKLKEKLQKQVKKNKTKDDNKESKETAVSSADKKKLKKEKSKINTKNIDTNDRKSDKNSTDKDLKSKLMALDDSDNDIELPKKVELRKEKMPDDIDMPTLNNDDKKKL